MQSAGISLTEPGIPDLYAKYGLEEDDSPERYWREELELEPVNLETVTKDTTVPVKIILPSGVNTARKTVDIDITVETNSEEN